MIELTDRLSPDRSSAIQVLLEQEVQARLERQASGYARGRLFAWLAYQPSFVEPAEAREQPTGQLWQVLRRLVPGIECAECFRNGEGSSPGIRPHKDASYADSTAWLLDLGQTSFRIWLPKSAVPPGALDARMVKEGKVLAEWEIALRGGELLRFNCKLMHGSKSAAPARWAIGMWRFKPQWVSRARFHGPTEGR
jgi:hypothetical protein